MRAYRQGNLALIAEIAAGFEFYLGQMALAHERRALSTSDYLDIEIQKAKAGVE